MKEFSTALEVQTKLVNRRISELKDDLANDALNGTGASVEKLKRSTLDLNEKMLKQLKQGKVLW
jgi:butyrate kinase